MATRCRSPSHSRSLLSPLARDSYWLVPQLSKVLGLAGDDGTGDGSGIRRRPGPAWRRCRCGSGPGQNDAAQALYVVRGLDTGFQRHLVAGYAGVDDLGRRPRGEDRRRGDVLAGHIRASAGYRGHCQTCGYRYRPCTARQQPRWRRGRSARKPRHQPGLFRS